MSKLHVLAQSSSISEGGPVPLLLDVDARAALLRAVAGSGETGQAQSGAVAPKGSEP